MKDLKIVYDEKRERYGELLSNLISSCDDVVNGDKTEVVGTPDGVVKASLIPENKFQDNIQNITSINKILFIGNSKKMKEKRIGINYKFDKYGIKFGWLGNHAHLFIDYVPYLEDEYEEFLNLFKEYRDNAEKLKTRKSVFLENKKITMGAVAASAVLPVIAPVTISVASAIKTSKIINQIEKQQYECGVLVVYMEYLNQFLDIKE